MPIPFVEIEFSSQPLVYVKTETGRQEIPNAHELQGLIANYTHPLTSQQVLQLSQLCAATWIFYAIEHNLFHYSQLPQSDLTEAQLLWDDHERLAHGIADGLVEISRILADENRFDEAIAVGKKSGYVGCVSETMGYIAHRLAWRGDFERAGQVIEEVLDSREDRVRQDVAMALFEADRLDEALLLLMPIHTHTEYLIQGLLTISKGLQAKQDARFKGIYEQALDIATNHANLIESHMISLVMVDQIDEAIKVAGNIKDRGYQARAYAELALAASYQNHQRASVLIGTAITNVKQLAAPFPDGVWRTTELIIRALVLQGKIHESLQIQRDFSWSSSTMFYKIMMRDLCHHNRLAEALELITTIESNPQKAFALKWLVRYLVEQGSPYIAEDIASHILPLANDKADKDAVHKEYAKAMGALGHLAEAFRYNDPYDPEEYIEDVAKWSPAMEQLEAGLSFRVLNEIVRIISYVQPKWRSIAPFLQ